MSLQSRARRVQEVLDAHYPNPPLPLQHTDAFSLLVAVLLSAQTTDVRVNKVTPGLFAEAPGPQAMAALGAERILEHIRSCGLAPTKARNIQRLSELLIERHQGQVPADLDALEALPGVGHKTAQVVMAQAFHQPAFPVDTHILRCAKRWKLSEGRNVRQVERDLKALYPPEHWNRLHLQIIWFGRERCPARGHQLQDCPICAWVE